MERTQSMTDASAPPRVLSGSYVDLPAVIGGAVLAAAAMSVFTAFGGALGFSSFSAEPGEGGSFTFWAVISVIWVAMTTLFSFAGGGYVTGRLRRRLEDASADEVAARDGLNGLIVWGLGVLLGAWLAAGLVSGVASMAGAAVSAVGSVAGGAVQAAGAAVGGVAQGVGSAAEGQGGSAFDYVTDTLLRPALDGAQQSNGSLTPTRPSMDDSELARQAGMILGNVLRTGEISEDETAFLKAATAQRTGMSEAEVEERVTAAVDGVKEMRAEAERMAEEAKQAAIDAAEAARKGAILSAFFVAALAIASAGAALSGGVIGGRHRDEGRLFSGFRKS